MMRDYYGEASANIAEDRNGRSMRITTGFQA